MLDALIKIYLGFLIVGSLIIALVDGVWWLAKRPRRHLVPQIMLWRNFFFLLSGLMGWYLFSSRLLENWVLLLSMQSLLVISLVGARAVERSRITKATDSNNKF